MTVPMRRKTSSEVRARRSHDALKKKALAKCPKCNSAVKPHTACAFCGSYKGKTVLKIKDKKAKSAEKKG